MFRKMLLLLLIVFAVGIFAPVGAQVQTDKFGALTDAAKFFPSSTPLYASIRTDGDYLNTLDSLLTTVQQRLGLPSAITLPQIFDEGLRGLDTDFATGVAPWLGDTLTFGIFPPDNLLDDTYRNDAAHYGILLNITNRDATTQFMRNLLRQTGSNYLEESGDDFTRFYFDSSFSTEMFVISNDYLTFTNTELLMPPFPVNASLFDSRAFANALNALPADSYNFAVYIDTPTVISYTLGANRWAYTGERLNALLMAQLLGPITVAGTIEDGNALILDGVLSTGNTTGLEALGLQRYASPIINPDFASTIPRDAIFAIHGTQMWGDINQLRENVVSVIRYFTATDLNPERDAKLQAFALEAQTVFERIMDAIVANMFGVSIQHDLGNWMSQDYIMFLRANPELDNPFLPVDMALVFEVSDPAQSLDSIQKLVRYLPINLRTLGVRNVIFRESRIGDADVLFIDIHDYSFEDRPILEFAISANEAVFVIGTQRAVTDVIRGNTGGAYPASQAYILPDANVVLYQNLPNALPVARALLPQTGMGAQDRQIVEALLNLLGEGVISVATLEDGTMVIRAVETLNIGR